MNKHASIELSEDLYRALDQVSRAAGGTPATHVERAIEAYLEDFEDLRAAEEIVRQRRKDGGKGDISLGELSRRLGLDD